MPHPFRFLDTGVSPAVFNMGLDESILHSVSSGEQLPTFRVYGWNPPAVSIGYFQGLEEEVDTAACRAHGVDVVRRITGGGSVFHQAEITYSIVIPEGHPLAPQSIQESYGTLCSGIVAGLKELGVASEFAPINDIVSGGRKISGNAQTRKKSCLLQHGTILLDLDVDLMFELLKVPQEKARGKLIEDVKARVTSLKAILKREILYAEIASALVRGFAKALDISFVSQAPSIREIERAREMAGSRCSDPAWSSRR